ncbi:MAG: tetraacyldisaccharide 4'-kinase [Halobacteriovoraceae bacterium]|nr:tetraacyldisaccharide 4'-kinase [Halobacteriovoraceae bacterium]|tara:strand:+ start:26546 stop:27610 length:1065 start_codon:yes stop_codon:yes gene_type:complete
MNLKVMSNMLLLPVSKLWDFLYRVRRSFYEYGIFKKEYFKVPIISVGNVTFGGTGKTPMIIWLVSKLEEYDQIPAVLTRGYKGAMEHKSGLIKGGQRFRSNPQVFGDEPMLISQRLKKGAVIVGKKRAQNLKKYFHEVQPDVVLLDDGFQHIQLYRSFNIVLFDALLPLDRYKTAPLGYLREGLTSLRHADAILVSRSDQATEEQLEGLFSLLRPYHREDTIIGKFRYIPAGLFDCYYKKQMDVDELAGKKVVALSAIASPEAFYKMLENAGAEIVEKIDYPDHHFFSDKEINDILLRATKHNAIVLTSEKDMVKIRRVSQDERILFLNIAVDFIGGEEELLSGIKKVINLDYQ